jgi:GNAT superfamily N-acetyltransferase
VKRGDYEISADPARLDADAIHAFLTTSYWCAGIRRDIVARAIKGSLCFGLYHKNAQVGFARVVTDEATYAYLCDVYVLKEHRGHGLGKWMMEAVMAHPSLQGLRRFTLVTRDAHTLYEGFGFKPLAKPEGHMEIHRPNAYVSPSIERK